jgi:hypothetical protein
VMDAIGWNLANSGGPPPPPPPPGPTGVATSPVTASLPQAQGTSGLAANAALATVAQTGGPAGDSYSYALGGAGAASFSLATANNAATLSAGASGVAGPNNNNGRLYALSVTATDTTTGGSSPAIPVDVIVGRSGNDNVQIATLTGSLAKSTPTFIYGLAGADQIKGSNMTGKLWFVGGAGADVMTGGSGVNDYLYGATSDSTKSAMDVINTFHAATDLIDLTGLGIPLNYAGQDLTTSLAAGSVAWQISGGNTFVYVNTSSSSETLTAANMKIELHGQIPLSSSNIVHL